MEPLFGVRAHDFGISDAAELSSRIAASGASCIQLALSKALPGSPDVPAALGSGGIRETAQAFSRNGISIAVLGCYIDTVCIDPGARNRSLDRFEAHLRSAREFGCRIVGTETGSPEPYGNSSEGRTAAFKTAVESVRRLARAAEAAGADGVYVCVEPVAEKHAVSSARLAKTLLDEIGSPALGIIFDPMNLVPRNGLESMEGFLDECFEAFGDRIMAVHAKDYRMVQGLNGREKSEALPAGTGEIDWEGLFRRLRAAGKAEVPIILENAGPEAAPLALARLKTAWDRAMTA